MADAPNLLRLLTELADPRNSALLQRFYDDPGSVMDEYGLTRSEQAAVLSGNLDLLRSALDEAALAAGYTIESPLGIVVTYTPTPPAPQRIIGTF